VRSAHRFSRPTLERAFAAFMLVVGTRFLWNLAG
jgi:uncharacterized membrane protein YfcA